MNVKLDYYNVTIPDPNLDFSDALDSIHSISQDSEDRLVRDGENVHWMHQLERDGRYYKGDLIRIDMEQGVTKAEILGSLEPVEIDEGEGIGYRTAFLYDPQLTTLVLQVNRRGVTASRFAQFFNVYSDSSEDVELLPYIRQDGMDRLNGLEKAHVFSIKIGNTGSSENLQNSGYSTRQKIEGLAEQVEAHRMEIRFSCGRKWRSEELSLPQIKDSIAQFISPDQEIEAEEIEINGRGPDNQMEKIRLVEERFRDEVNVEPGDFRILPYQARIQNLEASYRRNENEIRNLRSA